MNGSIKKVGSHFVLIQHAIWMLEIWRK